MVFFASKQHFFYDGAEFSLYTGSTPKGMTFILRKKNFKNN